MSPNLGLGGIIHLQKAFSEAAKFSADNKDSLQQSKTKEKVDSICRRYLQIARQQAKQAKDK